LTLGKPAALEDPPGAEWVERELASLTGCEAALLAPSTLHLFMDLFTLLARPGVGIFLDGGSYPISKWGAQHAALAGVPVRSFASHDLEGLRECINAAPAIRPIVVTDGLSPTSGAVAPLAGYAGLAALKGGLVVVDDTQALGILGTPTGIEAPYGAGGGGSLRHARFASPNILLVSSLAKALGAPVAMVGGAAAQIEDFRARSLTRVHCSPPSAAAIAAAGQAVEANCREGEVLRRRLAERVARFNYGTGQLGLCSNRHLFPVRPVRLPDGVGARELHAELAERGVRALLLGRPAGLATLCFAITARHGLREIDKAVESMRDALQRVFSKRKGDRHNETAQLRGRTFWKAI
jgi:8-amino-7-oxononanoate synthase